jgi:hypothetical protein
MRIIALLLKSLNLLVANQMAKRIPRRWKTYSLLLMNGLKLQK